MLKQEVMCVYIYIHTYFVCYIYLFIYIYGNIDNYGMYK